MNSGLKVASQIYTFPSSSSPPSSSFFFFFFFVVLVRSELCSGGSPAACRVEPHGIDHQGGEGKGGRDRAPGKGRRDRVRAHRLPPGEAIGSTFYLYIFSGVPRCLRLYQVYGPSLRSGKKKFPAEVAKFPGVRLAQFWYLPDFPDFFFPKFAKSNFRDLLPSVKFYKS